MVDIPKFEVAKSGRASCRTCGQKIIKDTNRVGIPYQFTRPDGNKITSYGWYHPECVPFKSIQDVMKVIDKNNSFDPAEKDKILSSLKKRKLEQEDILEKPFIEISKSGRSLCQKCNQKIEKDVYRVAEPSAVELENGRKFVSNKFFHLECYLKSSSERSLIFETLIKTSLKRKSISSKTEADLLEKKIQQISLMESTAEKVFALIGETPLEFGTLKTLAESKGISHESFKEIIEEGLLQGTLFEPKPGFIQKL